MSENIKTIQVLLVEDNPGDMRLMREFLSEATAEKFEVLMSQRISEAQKLLETNKVDVILSDLSLPDAKGFDTVYRLRSLAPNVPLVVITGDDTDAMAIQALKEGAQDYLTKRDVNSRMLSRVLRYAIERQRIEKELLQKSEELARSRAELEQLELFAFVATHDMREPLHKILSFGDLLKTLHAKALDGEGLNYLERIRTSAERMNIMFEQMRDLSRIAADMNPYETVDMNQLVRDVLKDMDPQLKETRAQVDVDSIPPVQASRVQVYQLLQNLILNAIKFHAPDITPHVQVFGRVKEDGSTEVSVRDNGIGFEEKYLDRIFKPFQRLHGRNEYPGSGIGLAICEKVILRHAGKITATSEPGRGSTFTFSLPKLSENSITHKA